MAYYQGRHRGDETVEYVIEEPSTSSSSPSRSYPSPGGFARGITQRSGSYSGKGMLAGELLIGFALIAVRLVGDATVSDDGTTVKANVLHPSGTYGPIPIMAGLLGSFFLLSFLAMGGGTRAKLAVILGGCIILTLGVRSYPEIVKVGSTFGNIGKITAPSPSGQLSDIYGNAGQAGPAPSAASNAANAASSTVQQMAGNNGLTYVEPTSLANIGKDIASAAEQAARQLIPGGTTKTVGSALSAAGNFLKSHF